MKSSVLARNILIHDQIKKIAEVCEKNNIKLVLLKGAALVELFPEYSFEREMEDIDVLVEKKDLKKFVDILKGLGYKHYPEDPNVLYNEEVDIKIDITTRLWYYSLKENKKLCNNLIKITNFYILPPKELLKHIVFHSYLEHNFVEEKWTKDVLLLKEKFAVDVNEEELIPKFVLKLLNKKSYYKGHLIQFLYLPWYRKINFLFTKLFPNKNFMFHRYGFKNVLLLPFFYIYRWLCFVKNLYYLVKG